MTWLTFPYHGDPHGHAHELAFGPYMSVDAQSLFLALTVEAGDGGMMGHLLGHKPEFVAFGRVLSCQLFMASRRMGGSPLWLDPVFGNLPGAVKRLTDDGVVGLLGQGPLAALMEGREIIFHEANDSLLWCGPGGDGQQQVRMGHKVCVHLQQGSLLQDERGKHHLCWQGDRNRRRRDYTGGCNLHLANPTWLQPEHGFFGLLDKRHIRGNYV